MSDHSAIAVPLEASSSLYTTTTTTTFTATIATTTTGTAGMAAADPPNREDARRLFMGNLPKVKTEVDICEEVSRHTDGLVRVITYKNFENPSLHRGFCFLDYESSAAAAEAKRRLSRCTVFGCKTIVDWADPEPEADAQKMASVRILFVRQYGGMLDERTLADVFGQYGTVERVKNLKNYAFVHFERRSDAKDAMEALDGAVDEATGVRVDVSWAKPPAEKHVRERVLRDRERRIRLQAYGTPHNPEHSVVPFCRVDDDEPSASTSTSKPVWTTNFATPATSVTDTPYSNYDHYEYDFYRQTFACMNRQLTFETGGPLQRRPEQRLRQPEQRQRCRCIADVPISVGASSMNSGSHRAECDDDGVRSWRYRQRLPLQQRDAVGTPSLRLAGTSTARHDHGDCVIDTSDLDSIILNFFHKKSHRT